MSKQVQQIRDRVLVMELRRLALACRDLGLHIRLSDILNRAAFRIEENAGKMPVQCLVQFSDMGQPAAFDPLPSLAHSLMFDEIKVLGIERFNDFTAALP